MSQQRNLLSFFAKRPAADAQGAQGAAATDEAQSRTRPLAKRHASAAADERPTPTLLPAVVRDAAPASQPCASPADPPATAEQCAARRAKAQRLLGAGVAPKASAAEAGIEARFAFLEAGVVRDAEKRLPSHESYDARTLFVPPSVKLSPSQKAYWDIKKLYGAAAVTRLGVAHSC